MNFSITQSVIITKTIKWITLNSDFYEYVETIGHHFSRLRLILIFTIVVMNTYYLKRFGGKKKKFSFLIYPGTNVFKIVSYENRISMVKTKSYHVPRHLNSTIFYNDNIVQ